MKLRTPSRRYVAAMVLGTALSTMGASASAAAASEISENAVNSLSRYCTVCWRNARLPVDRWGDCTQEVLRRLLDRVSPSSWTRLLTHDSAERRELVRAIDAVKKKALRDSKRWTPLTGVVADQHSSDERARAETREAVRQAGDALLSSRQQHIIQLSFDGCSVQDISSALGLSPDRVSDEKYKAIRKLRGHFQTVASS